MTSLGRLYDNVYGAICGRHPDIRPWHFQWLAVKDLYPELRTRLAELRGSVLDVGCGTKPYRVWLRQADRYVGLDVSADGQPDVLVEPGKPWPLEDASFDALISTQVLEHVTDLDNVVREMARVLRPGATAVITLPFIYNEHGAPGDFRRYSVHGATEIFPKHWEIVSVRPLGAVGSSTGVLLLNWIDESTNASRPGRLVKGILLPLWIVLSGLVNLVATALDALDRTSGFYVNLCLVVRKPTT
jgi:SAM-dependent methyltransferase